MVLDRMGNIPEYPSFKSLADARVEGRDFIRVVKLISGAKVAVIAPHGGRIEPRTETIASTLAGNDFSLYCFISRLPKDEANLHIASQRFVDPACLELVRLHPYVVAIHGWSRPSESILIGGLDTDLGNKLAAESRTLRVETHTDAPGLAGTHPINICNRGKAGRGVQLEFTKLLRNSSRLQPLLLAFRSALLRHQNSD